MGNIPRLEKKLKNKIEKWFSYQGDRFIICTKEFCQGNRASLKPLMELLRDLAASVFTGEGVNLREDLLEDLEYGIFDLIGRFNSATGGDDLNNLIQINIIDHITEIFAETKRRWNLNNFKITESIEEIDPLDGLIEGRTEQVQNESSGNQRRIEIQAKEALAAMAVFAKRKFRGEKNRKIAINMLENPEKARDFPWFAEVAGTSVGSVKVTLTRIKQTLAQSFSYRKLGDELTVTRIRDF